MAKFVESTFYFNVLTFYFIFDVSSFWNWISDTKASEFLNAFGF